MNIPHKQLSVDINRKNQYTVDFIGHVNDKDVRYIDVTFNAGGTPITLDEGCTATVTYVSEGVLIDQAAECTVSGSTVVIGVDSEKVENLRSGILEVQPKVVDPNGRILTMQIPILVRISPDIAEHGQVDDDSLGSYAEVVREIAAARGAFPSLNDRLNNTAAPTDEQVAEAVSDYLDEHPTMLIKFDTVSEMLAADLNVDNIIITAGYHTPNDGGGAMYRVVETTDKYAETLENELKAELIIIGGCKNARQFGAYGDGSHNDTVALQAWLNNVAVNGGYAYLPKGHYIITSPLTIDWSHNGGLTRNFLQKIVGDGCTSYETDFDNSVIIASGIGAKRGAVEFLSDGNTWGTQVQISDIGIYCSSACDPMSFCLFYGDSRHLALNRVKMKGYNDILVRCGSKVVDNSGKVTDSYEHICCTIEHCDLITRGTKGFSLLPESVLVPKAASMLDTLSLRDSFIGGVFTVHCNNFSAESCTITIAGMKDKLSTVEDENMGKFNGYQIDYATGFLIIETASTIIKNTYFEDYKRAIDIAPICGNIRTVLVEGCYFNPGSNQKIDENTNIKSDYGVLIRTGKSGTKVVYTEISHNVFRHDGDLIAFTLAAIKNEASEKLLCYANAGRPAAFADQIESNYGELISENELVNPDISNKADKATTLSGYGITNAYTKTEVNGMIPTVPTKVSDLSNDSGFLTLSTLPKYNGGVQ